MNIEKQLLSLILSTVTGVLGTTVLSVEAVAHIDSSNHQSRQNTIPIIQPNIAQSNIAQKIADLYQLGTEHKAAGKYNAARQAYEEIFSLLTSENIGVIPDIQSRDLIDIESVLESLVLIYWSEQRPEKAVDALGHVLQMHAEHPDLLDIDFDSQVEEESLAISYSDEKTGALIAQSLGNTVDPSVVKTAFSTVMVRKGRVLEAITAFNQQQRSQIDSAIQTELDSLYRTLADLTLSMKQARSQDRSSQEDSQTDSEIDAEIVTLQDRITAINIDLIQGNYDWLEWLYVTPSGSGSVTHLVSENMPDNAVFMEMVEYSAANSDRRYAAYVVTKQGRIEAVDLGSAAEINRKAVAFRQAIESRSASAKTVGRELYKQIIEPVHSLIGGQTQLLISPDSHLNTIPFEAFVDDSNQYLVESYQVSYLLSGKDIVKFSASDERRSQDRSRRYRSPFTVVANPDYDTFVENDYEAIATAATNRRSSDFGSPLFADLPGTAQEAAAIEAVLPISISLTQAEPTESIIKQLQSPGILHFATHGFFLADSSSTHNTNANSNRDASLDVISTGENRPFGSENIENPLLRAGLVLTGANNPGDTGEDGILTALEVSEMNLHGTELVVLSACETGLGEVSSGEGVYGMRRAFAMAGAASQIMSLWQVDDAGTSELMSIFYENLMQDRQSRSEALRNAQLALLNTGTYQHPYYWSSFILSGDWHAFETPPDALLSGDDPSDYIGVTTENFQLAARIEEYRALKPWRDDMLAQMLELEDQRRYTELAEMRAAFNRVLEERAHPDFFKLSESLSDNLRFRMNDLHQQQRYPEALEVAEAMIEIQQSGAEEADPVDLLRSLQALAFLHLANGDDISAVLTHKRAATAYENRDR